MSSKQQEQQRLEDQQEQKIAQRKRHESGLLEAVVRDNVLSALGKPTGLYRVMVHCVWGDHYRANVFAGPDVASFKVIHSYFLEADGNGKILTSTPAITRLY